MSFGGLILTNQGRNEIASAISNERALDFTHVQLGDGIYEGSYLSKTELTNKVMEIPVSRVMRKDNEVTGCRRCRVYRSGIRYDFKGKEITVYVSG